MYVGTHVYMYVGSPVYMCVHVRRARSGFCLPVSVITRMRLYLYE
jgi:hypothetical protein